VTKDEVLATLRVLSLLERPVWLAGGVAADFHVGRWTRDHGDIDLVTFEEHREGLDRELVGLGFAQTDDRGWITKWSNSGMDPGEVSLAYERRLDETTGALVMLPSFAGVEPGIYPGFPGNLALDRFAVLEDVRFRVCSAEDEWSYATAFRTIRPGARDRDTVRHNLDLLETVIEDLDAVRTHVSRRLLLK
jgi:Aminoglycoside-2''-adenylyltransferase